MHDVPQIGEVPHGRHLADASPVHVGGQAMVPPPLEVEGHQVHAEAVVAREEMVRELGKCKKDFFSTGEKF